MAYPPLPALPVDEDGKIVQRSHWMYFVITGKHVAAAKENWDAFISGGRAWDGEFDPPHMTFLSNLHHAHHETRIAKIFAGLTAEAYINHLAYEKLEKFHRNGLDRLSMPMKWATIPTLVYGKGISPSSHIIAGLENVRKTRDDLVHYKSRLVATQPGKLGIPYIDRFAIEIDSCGYMNDHGEMVREAEACRNAVRDAILALNELDPIFEAAETKNYIHSGRY